MMKILKKIYAKIHKWSARKYQDHHTEQFGVDIRCPRCKDWFSISGIEHKHRYLPEPNFGCHVVCGKCGEDSYWNLVAAPVPLHCDSSGMPFGDYDD